MLHNKFMAWEKFLGLMEQVEKVSPWLSRQIVKRVSEWPFWMAGLKIRDWAERAAHVHMPFSLRNSVDGEICQGHLLLGAEFCLRLVLLRHRQEFPFHYRIKECAMELHHNVDQSVDFRFKLDLQEWERIRLELARGKSCEAEFVISGTLADGRSALQASFKVGFQLENFLPA